MLNKWFQRTGKRDEIFLASKFGIVMEEFQFKGINSSGEYCKQACEASLKKLGIEYIDLCELFRAIFRGCDRICYPFLVLNSIRLRPSHQSGNAYRGNNASFG
jgi:hypothetical protein